MPVYNLLHTAHPSCNFFIFTLIFATCENALKSKKRRHDDPFKDTQLNLNLNIIIIKRED